MDSNPYRSPAAGETAAGERPNRPSAVRRSWSRTAMGVACLRVERPDEVILTRNAALTMVFKGGQAVAVLLSQQLIGAKSFAH